STEQPRTGSGYNAPNMTSENLILQLFDTIPEEWDIRDKSWRPNEELVELAKKNTIARFGNTAPPGGQQAGAAKKGTKKWENPYENVPVDRILEVDPDFFLAGKNWSIEYGLSVIASEHELPHWRYLGVFVQRERFLSGVMHRIRALRSRVLRRTQRETQRTEKWLLKSRGPELGYAEQPKITSLAAAKEAVRVRDGLQGHQRGQHASSSHGKKSTSSTSFLPYRWEAMLSLFQDTTMKKRWSGDMSSRWRLVYRLCCQELGWTFKRLADVHIGDDQNEESRKSK
ncbi:unnamed protein product, partial [Amoebophrya sp. A25]